MKEEWLNRIAITWNNRTYLRHVRNILDLYSTATEAVARHPELITQAALEFAQKELDFIEKHHIVPYYYKDDNYPYRLAQCADAPLLLYAKGNVDVNPKSVVSVAFSNMITIALEAGASLTG